MKKLFIGNIPFSVSEGTLEAFIQEFGVGVREVKIIRDLQSQRSKGFGFAVLDEEQDLDEAISALNSKTLEGRTLRVDRAHERGARRSDGPGPGF